MFADLGRIADVLGKVLDELRTIKDVLVEVRDLLRAQNKDKKSKP